MTVLRREELLARLRALADEGDKGGDWETAHIEADDALLRFIDDDEITLAFKSIPRWYA